MALRGEALLGSMASKRQMRTTTLVSWSSSHITGLVSKMLAIIVFWALILVSLKLLVTIIIDSFRPLPKPTGKRESRESMFLCPTKAALTAIKNGRGPDDLPTWPAPPPAQLSVKATIDLWGGDLEAIKRLVGLRKWHIARHGRPQDYQGLGNKTVRAKLALAKSLGMDVEEVLSKDDWINPDYLRWNGLNLNLVLGTRTSAHRNLNFGWIKKSAYYGFNAADYYVWMLPNHDFSKWEVMGVLSYSDLKALRDRQDLYESHRFFGINRPAWVPPLAAGTANCMEGE